MKVAVLDDYQAVAHRMADWSRLPQGTEVQFFQDHLSDEDQLAERLKGFQIVMGMRERTPFPRSLLARLPELRLLVTTGARNAAFDVAAATDLGVVVCGTGGAGEGPTELTWGLIIGLLRQIPQEDQRTRKGEWGTAIGVGLKGTTLGLLGLGHIGGLMARVGNAFDMNVVAWSQNLNARRAAECLSNGHHHGCQLPDENGEEDKRANSRNDAKDLEYSRRLSKAQSAGQLPPVRLGPGGPEKSGPDEVGEPGPKCPSRQANDHTPDQPSYTSHLQAPYSCCQSHQQHDQEGLPSCGGVGFNFLEGLGIEPCGPDHASNHLSPLNWGEVSTS